MGKLIFDRGNFMDLTSVSNIFIDEYMPKANGEFVKIYLYLLRLVNTGLEDISTAKIADKFNITEGDVIRAFNYWQQESLLALTMDENNNIIAIRLESFKRNRYIVKGLNKNDSEVLPKASGEIVSASIPESTGIIIPSKRKYSPSEVDSFSKDERLQGLMFLAQTYLGKTLNANDINSIIYMLFDLELDVDFIEYIIVSCISKNQKRLSSIEKQAVDYKKRGIEKIEDAKLDDNLRSDICQSIYKVFGLNPSTPIKKDLSLIQKWTSDYGFSKDIIIEACERTLAHTRTASFPYADKILFDWSCNKVKSLSDIEKLDQAHSKENEGKFSSKASSAKASRPKNSKPIEERGYDHSSIEQQVRLINNNKLKKLVISED